VRRGPNFILSITFCSNATIPLRAIQRVPYSDRMRQVGAALFVFAIGISPAHAGDPLGVDRDLWSRALDAALLERSDLAFRNDYVRVDAARLPVVDRAMAAPADLPGWLAHQGRATAQADWDRSAAAETAWRLADRRDHDSLAAAPPLDHPIVSWSRSMYPVLVTLARLNAAGADVDAAHAPARLRVPDTVRSFLTDEVPLLLWEDPDDEFRSAEWQDSVQQHEEEIARKLVGHLHDIPSEAIWTDGLLLTRAVSAWAAGVVQTGLEAWTSRLPIGDHVTVHQTPFGRIALGTRGDDRYTGRYAFILDPGGNDHYALEYDAAHPSRVILDLSGDDTYEGRTNAALAGGFWGTQVLYDLAGDDVYRARSLDLGAGLYGWGVLIDASGHDIYEGDTFVQGAGGFGYGLLVDTSGNDIYRGALFAQGFGFVAGIGVLVDGEGNDHYSAGGLYKDVLRYTDRYLSLSQGFAMGIRPFLSGGVGLLLDGAGNDDYHCDIFGQGASYWWGIGGLWDGQGNDRYLAFQYAQGSATHMTAGILVDEAGDDVYFSKGVSQGCGHDLAPGLLWDLGGNDTYTADDLSQGAGSANGLGALYDAAGDDRYYVKSKRNTQGYGNPRRDYGSIGLFLDAAGVDRYDGPGADSTWWQIPSKWGIGIDYGGDDREP